MISGKALLIAAPLALTGGWLAHSSGARIGPLRAELESLDAQGRAEGESFVRTLQGAHAERQLQFLNARQEAASQLSRTRRNQLIGWFLLVGSAIAFTCVRVAQRVSRELDATRRMVDTSWGRRT